MNQPHPLTVTRHHHGVTIDALAAATGLDARILYQIEEGRRDPSPLVYARLASQDIDVEELSAADVQWYAERRRADRDAIQAGHRASADD